MRGKPLAITIIGAGSLAREVIAVLEATRTPIAGLIVEPGYPTHPVAGLRVTDEWHRLGEAGTSLVIAIGDGDVRRRLADDLPDRDFAAVIHPAAMLGPRVIIGPGTMILGSLNATTDIVIGDHVLVNPGCLIAHDCQVGSFASLSPGVNLAGGVRVEDGAFVGTGAVVTPGCVVGAWAVVGAGAVVIDDVPPESVVAGVPARRIIRHRATAP